MPQTVVVIDPGHGGIRGEAEDGAVYNGVTERDINMATAKAMAEELSKYEGVKVYLTHDSPDQAMTLKERAEFAKSVQADYLVSIHYNASEEHEFYGSEVWIPSIGSYYVNGYHIAEAVLEGFREWGLHIRGIKTRVGDGNDEYYGIIRESEHRNITGIIIEHCFVDNERDKIYFDEESDYVTFGRLDATAVAKALKLKSTERGTDYTDYPSSVLTEPQQRVWQDITPPEYCVASLTEPFKGDGSLSVTITSKDRESRLGYFSYSLDGGSTYSPLYEWNDWDADDSEKVVISNVESDTAALVVRVYNDYNLKEESEILYLEGIRGEIWKPAGAYRGEKLQTGSEQEWDDVKQTAGATALIVLGIFLTVMLERKRRGRKRSTERKK